MKTMNINKISIISSFIALSFLLSCSMIEELEYDVVQNPLQMHGGEVTLRINGKFVEKGINAKAVAEVTPILFCSDGNEISFQTEIFQGPKAAGNGKVVPKEGMSFSYSSTIPFQKSMAEADLKVLIKAKMGSKDLEITSSKIADGTTTTPLLIDLDDQVILTGDNFVRTNSFTKTAVINFAKGKHNITSKETKDADIKEALDFISSSMEEGSRINILSVDISSYASPEGEVDLNINLAEDRGKSAVSFLMSKAKKMKFEPAKEESFFNVSPKGEDWAGFKEEVSKTSHEDKELILRVLQMTSDVNKRELEIRNMAKTYKFLEKEVLPQLRRSTITINYEKVGYSDDELANLVGSNPDTLSVEEILHAGNLESDLNVKLKNYKEAQRLYPNDWRIANNIGYVLYVMGDVDGAGDAFEKALSITDNPTVTNNVAAVKHRQAGKGNDDIVSYLESSNTTESKYNLGLIRIEEGKYEEAITLMDKSKTYNLALANLLAEHYDIAGDIIVDANNSEANAFYLKAIIGARTNNSEMLYESLKSCFDKDASYKNKAKKDREFVAYFDNADFLALF